MNYRFIVTGGGTSGHINPALTIAGCLKDRCDANGDTCEIKFTGRAQGLEGELVPKAGYDFINVEAKPVPLKPSPKIFAAIKALQKGTKQCKSLIEEFSPDAVVSTGGYVSAPLLRAAKKTKTPIVIHESNAFPGRANKLYAKGAELVLTGFPDENGDFSKAKRVVCVGNPVRPQMFSHTTEDARKELDLAGEDKLVFAMGGSLGAATITNFVVGAAKDFPDVKFVLSCGKHNAVELPKDLPANLEIKDYIDNPDVYLSAADVCILRAGAVTCAELCATGAVRNLNSVPLCRTRPSDI